MNSESGSFPAISESHWNHKRTSDDHRDSVLRGFGVYVPVDPSPLINAEIPITVAPLTVSDKGVGNGEWNSNNLKDDLSGFQFRFTLKGFIPGLFGLLGIAWGWWNIRRRNEHTLPWSPLAFLLGCILWAYACSVCFPLERQLKPGPVSLLIRLGSCLPPRRLRITSPWRRLFRGLHSCVQ